MKEKKEDRGHALPEGKWHVAGQSGVGHRPAWRATRGGAHRAPGAGGPAQRPGSRPLPLNAPPSILGPAPRRAAQAQQPQDRDPAALATKGTLSP